MNNVAVTIAIITSGVSLILGSLTFVRQLRKDSAEVHKMRTNGASAVSQSTVILLEPLQKRIEDLESDLEQEREVIGKLQAELHTLRTELEEYRKLLQTRDRRIRYLVSGIRVLVAQLCDNDIDPAFNADITFGREADSDKESRTE